MRTWSHGHSLGTGAFVGLLLTGHVWAVALVCLAVGVLAGRFWATLAALAGRLIRADRVMTRRAPW